MDSSIEVINMKIEIKLDDNVINLLKNYMEETGCKTIKEQCEYTLKTFAEFEEEGENIEDMLMDFTSFEIDGNTAYYKVKEDESIVLFYTEDKENERTLNFLKDLAQKMDSRLVDIEEIWQKSDEGEDNPLPVTDWVSGMTTPITLNLKRLSKLSIDFYFTRDLNRDEVWRLCYRIESDLRLRYEDEYDGLGINPGESYLDIEDWEYIMKELSKMR